MSISLESLYTEISRASDALEIIEKKREFLVRKIQHLQGLSDCLRIEDQSLDSEKGSRPQLNQDALNGLGQSNVEEGENQNLVAKDEKLKIIKEEKSNIPHKEQQQKHQLAMLAASLPVRIAREFTGSNGEGLTSREVFSRIKVLDQTVKIGTVQGYLSKWKSLGLLKTKPREGASGFLYFCTPKLVAWLDKENQKPAANRPKGGAFIRKSEPTKSQKSQESRLRLQPKA